MHQFRYRQLREEPYNRLRITLEHEVLRGLYFREETSRIVDRLFEEVRGSVSSLSEEEPN